MPHPQSHVKDSMPDQEIVFLQEKKQNQSSHLHEDLREQTNAAYQQYSTLAISVRDNILCN